MQEQSNISISCINGRESLNFSLLICGSIARVCFACSSRMENRWLCHSVCINCWSVCCTLSTENDSDSICLMRKALLQSLNSSFHESDCFPILKLFYDRQYVTYLHERFQTLQPLSHCDMLRGEQER